MKKPRVLVSACIEHDHCRYDSSMISSETVSKLKGYVDFITVCPEMAIGLPSPRESLRLISDGGIKLVSSVKGIDHTDKMIDLANKYIDKDYDGIILKAKSPSCGLRQVKVYKGIGKVNTIPVKEQGIFASIIEKNYQLIPIETERRLSNYQIRENFYISLFTLSNFKIVGNMKELVDFHSRYKYLLMSYSVAKLKILGNIVANHDKLDFEILRNNYLTELIGLLKMTPTQKRRIDTLTHIYGYFKKRINQKEKVFYFDALDNYLNKQIPFSNLVQILHSWAIRFEDEYLLKQAIFSPYPKGLRSVIDSGKSV